MALTEHKELREITELMEPRELDMPAMGMAAILVLAMGLAPESALTIP
jgi:hypothetical protein